MELEALRDLARLAKQQARRVEREAHTFRQIAAEFERTVQQALTDTSQEETGHDTDENTRQARTLTVA